MSKDTGTKLLYLAIGTAVGAAVGYIAASEKRKDWIRDINCLVAKVKRNSKGTPKKLGELEKRIDLEKTKEEKEDDLSQTSNG